MEETLLKLLEDVTQKVEVGIANAKA